MLLVDDCSKGMVVDVSPPKFPDLLPELERTRPPEPSPRKPPSPSPKGGSQISAPPSFLFDHPAAESSRMGLAKQVRKRPSVAFADDDFEHEDEGEDADRDGRYFLKPPRRLNSSRRFSLPEPAFEALSKPRSSMASSSHLTNVSTHVLPRDWAPSNHSDLPLNKPALGMALAVGIDVLIENLVMAHGFSKDVVRRVLERCQSFEQADKILEQMRKKAEEVANGLLALELGKPVGWEEEEEEEPQEYERHDESASYEEEEKEEEEEEEGFFQAQDIQAAQEEDSLRDLVDVDEEVLTQPEPVMPSPVRSNDKEPETSRIPPTRQSGQTRTRSESRQQPYADSLPRRQPSPPPQASSSKLFDVPSQHHSARSTAQFHARRGSRISETGLIYTPASIEPADVSAYAPPSGLRAEQVMQLEGRGRVEKAKILEQRRVSFGGSVSPTKMGGIRRTLVVRDKHDRNQDRSNASHRGYSGGNLTQPLSDDGNSMDTNEEVDMTLGEALSRESTPEHELQYEGHELPPTQESQFSFADDAASSLPPTPREPPMQFSSQPTDGFEDEVEDAEDSEEDQDDENDVTEAEFQQIQQIMKGAEDTPRKSGWFGGLFG
jgi:hypothetical protein